MSVGLRAGGFYYGRFQGADRTEVRVRVGPELGSKLLKIPASEVTQIELVRVFDAPKRPKKSASSKRH